MKNVIFDIGDVLIKFDTINLLNKLFDNEETRDVMVKAFFNAHAWVPFDLGDMHIKDAFEHFSKQFPGYENDIKRLLDYYTDWFLINQENVDLLYKLKEEGYHLYYLSNFDEYGFNFMLNNFDFFKLFDGGIVSYQEKLIKPDSKIYEKLLEKYQLKREDCIFIDDREINVEASKNIGMHAVLYNGNDIYNEIKKWE